MSGTILEYSSEMKIPKGKLEIAKKIIEEQGEELETCTEFVEIDERRMVILFSDADEFDYMEDVVEPMARALIEGMKSNQAFILEWAYTCNEPIRDQFGGGGAFVIMRGVKTLWIDPSLIAANWIKRERKKAKRKKGE